MSAEILYDKDRCPVFGHAYRVVDPPNEPRKLCCINCGLEKQMATQKTVGDLTKIIQREIDSARRIAAGAVVTLPDELREWFDRKAKRLQNELNEALNDHATRN